LAEPALSRVLISYSHDSPEHRGRVLGLARRLRADGIDAMIDQFVQSPPEGWPAWCEKEICDGAFVLMVCTETYLRRINGEEEPDRGLGVRWEGRLIKQHLYAAGAVSNRFVPVLLADGSPDHVPIPVKGATIFRVETADGYEALCRLLTDQPLAPLPPLGPRRELLPLYSADPESGREHFVQLRKDLTEFKELQELLPAAVYEESIRTMTLHILKKMGYG
jgi:hypothetical protein